jgi:hypothetical protein
MSFPATPTNGQLATVNGITYFYNSSYNAWLRQGNTASVSNLAITSTQTSTTSSTGALTVAGGVGIGGNLNVGSVGAQHNIQGNLLIGNGTVASSAVTTLEVNQNSANPLYSTSVIHASTSANATGKITLDSFTNQAVFIARRADGVPSTPTAVQSGEPLGGIIMRGYGATGYLVGSPGSTTGVLALAQQNFSDTAQGTSITVSTIPLNSNLAVAALTIGSSGQGTAGNVSIFSNANSVSTTTGALTVAGGLGVGGNITAPVHVATNGLIVTNANINTSYTSPAGMNMLSVGPVTVASNVTVTVATGQRWLIL